MSDFQKFKKIPRLTKGWAVSEKIDGSNAQIHIVSWADVEMNCLDDYVLGSVRDLVALAGSRNRYITPEADNFGFAQWVEENVEDLSRLGYGRHYGEWFGPGIQKNPLGVSDKRLALFNPKWEDQGPDCVEVVPQLGHAASALGLDILFDKLRLTGSQVEGSGAVHCCLPPEGIIAYHLGSKQLYKRTLNNDGGKHAV